MNFVTIASFNSVHDLYPFKVNLEHNGIQCFIRDQYSAQVTPYLTNSIGGVKLQVLEKDAQNAIELLKEAGYENKEEYNELPQVIGRFEEITGGIPILKKFKPLGRLFILLLLLAILLKFIFTL